MTYPFKGLPINHFSAALIDPPWHFKAFSEKGEQGVRKHYDVLSLDDLKKLPVADLFKDDAVIGLWVIDTHIPQALDLLDAWEFKYKTVLFHWTKLNRDGTPFAGQGFWTRANPELCLLATRGRPARVFKDVRRLIDDDGFDSDHLLGFDHLAISPSVALIRSPRREHSRKPEDAYDRLERLVAGPYLDLFSRRSRPNWTAWGHEAGKFDPPALRPARSISRLLGSPEPRKRTIEDLLR